MEWSEVGYIALGIIATLIASVVLKIIELRFNKAGSVKFYGKITELEDKFIEIKLEVKNTTNDVYFVRQFTLHTVKGSEITQTFQANKSSNSKTGDIQYFADEGFYSFALPPKSISHYVLCFIFADDISRKDIESCIVRYYDNKDNVKTLHMNIGNADWQTLECKK